MKLCFAFREFSVASDVWSFGIVQWEMFNPTLTPYQVRRYNIIIQIFAGFSLHGEGDDHDCCIYVFCRS